jgi:hypothetical protein
MPEKVVFSSTNTNPRFKINRKQGEWEIGWTRKPFIGRKRKNGTYRDSQDTNTIRTVLLESPEQVNPSMGNANEFLRKYTVSESK